MNMTIDQELSMPEMMKKTRLNKIQILACCWSIEKAVETIKARANGAPLLDDPEHAKLVEEFRIIAKQAEIAAWRAAEFGRS